LLRLSRLQHVDRTRILSSRPLIGYTFEAREVNPRLAAFHR